jgi:hypothetical protein
MQWVEMLPEVGDAISKRRAALAAMMDEAAALEAKAKELKAGAYRTGLALMADCRRFWTDEEIRTAQEIAGRLSYTPGQRFTFTPGQAVNCNGYPGVVVGMYSEGMVNVRLASGQVCVSASFPDCFPV